MARGVIIASRKDRRVSIIRNPNALPKKREQKKKEAKKAKGKGGSDEESGSDSEG